jgi:hypothetical protein
MKTHKVRSRSDKNKIHTVEIHDTFETCTCEAYKYRNYCKHIDFILDKYYRKSYPQGWTTQKT